MIRRLSCALIFFLFLLLVASACFGPGSGKVHHIGRDSTWYPLNVQGRERNLVVFSDDLLAEIMHEGGVQIKMLPASSDRLFQDLSDGRYDAVLTAIDSTAQNRARYDISDVYFRLGPVLVVPISSEASSLRDLSGLTVGIHRGSSVYYNLLQDRRISIVPFDNLTVSLDSLDKEEISGIIMESMQANILIQGPYRGRLKVVGTPLTQQGISLVALKGAHEELIQAFNEGLQKVKSDGRYDALLMKWSLNQ